MEQEFAYDLLVIGGGSGGISAARSAAALGKKVALCDFVKPSPQGTKWSVGGTCVNVGCIPKKLMHYAASFGELRHDQINCGWKLEEKTEFDWLSMKKNVSSHIYSTNSGYKKTFRSEKVTYLNKLASFVDKHTILLSDGKAPDEQVTAKYILIATGGRPNYPEVPGLKENCISSDDIFWMKKAPGKTLVIGAGYIALECGGFLRGMGFDVSILVRSTPLRNFDQDMVARVVERMTDIGVKFHNNSNPESFEKTESGMVLAKWKNAAGEIVQEEFETVLVATGRAPDLSGLNLPAVGVQLKDSKVIVDPHHKTTTENIFAVGDIIVGSPELTPVAIKEGAYLAEYLFNNGTKTVRYDCVPTTIFTPLEYARIGLSEEDANKK